MNNFRIGDKVITTKSVDLQKTIQGKIIEIKHEHETHQDYLIEFNSFMGGHDGGGIGRDGYCWWVREQDIELLEKRETKTFGIVKFCKENYK
jgi:hypothetical protein